MYTNPLGAKEGKATTECLGSHSFNLWQNGKKRRTGAESMSLGKPTNGARAKKTTRKRKASNTAKSAKGN